MVIGTNTAEVDRTGDKAFKSNLHNFLEHEAEEDRRAALIEEYANFLLQEGQDCYPWTFEHFEEAMGNAPDEQRRLLWTFIVVATEQGLKHDNSNHLAMVCMRQMVERYWTVIAAMMAEAEFAHRWD